MRILKIKYKNGSVSVVGILRHKNTDTFSFVNFSKAHICPCVFNSEEDALADLKNYPQIESWEEIKSKE